MSPGYRVTLTSEERSKLEALTRENFRQSIYPRPYVATLRCRYRWSGLAGIRNSDNPGVTSRTIEHIKQRFVEERLETALERKPTDKPPRDVKFDCTFEAKLIALDCSDAPEGQTRWTVRPLADKAAELNYAESVSHMTLQRVAKNELNLTSASTGKSLRKGTRPS